MVDVTVCIPIGPYHKEAAKRAIASAKAQTVETAVMPFHDTQKRGPGFVRNRMLEQVTTPYLVWLDADDWIEATFVEKTLAMAGERPNRYVFTDWYEGEAIRHAPAQPWCGGSWHVITTLIPTRFARNVGGFDETLTAAEDTDFYMKLTTRGMWGVHVAEPLFHYSNDGRRSDEANQSGRLEAIRAQLYERYAGSMGCCGEQVTEHPPVGERQPGDVLAQALWNGKRTSLGMISGRMYPRIAYPHTTWLDPRDAKARPDQWLILETPTIDTPVVLNGVEQIGSALANVMRPPTPPEPTPEQHTGRAALNEIMRKARRGG